MYFNHLGLAEAVASRLFGITPNDHGGAGSQVAFSYCRSLYALALMFPPKLSSHTPPCRGALLAALTHRVEALLQEHIDVSIPEHIQVVVERRWRGVRRVDVHAGDHPLVPVGSHGGGGGCSPTCLPEAEVS
jgi:hypothetical protein